MRPSHTSAFCAECGSPQPAGTAFCGGCGAQNAPISPPGEPAAPNASPADSTVYHGLTPVAADTSPSEATIVTGSQHTPSPGGYQGQFAGSGGDNATMAFGAGPPPPMGGSVPYYGVPGDPYGAPATPPPPARKGTRNVLIGAAGAAVVIAGVVLGMNLLGGDDETVGTDAPATAESGTTQVVVPAEAEQASAGDGSADSTQTTAPIAPAPSVAPSAPPAAPAPAGNVHDRYSIHHTESGFGGAYSKASAITSVTSAAFTRAVASTYAETGSSGSLTLTNVYSPVTGRTYTMNCRAQGDNTVMCSGGNNARVLLYN